MVEIYYSLEVEMNKKLISLFLVVVVFFSAGFASEVGANSSYSKNQQVEHVTISYYQDGSVIPIDKVEQLNEAQLEKILIAIGYSDQLIKDTNLKRKRELASYGGQVVDVSHFDLTREYVSSDGTILKVTAENLEEVRQKQLQDVLKLNRGPLNTKNFNLIDIASQNCGEDGSCTDGTFYAYNTITKVGTTSTQREYLVQMNFIFDGIMNFALTDSAGMHWGNHSPVATTASTGLEHRMNYNNSWRASDLPKLDLSSNFGIGARFDVRNGTQINGNRGYFSENIKISSTHVGEELTISNGYQHPWIPNNWSITISYGGVGLSGGIGTGDRWTWRANFKVT